MRTGLLVIYVLSGVIAAWGVLIFFENTFFAAPAFGVAAPSWSTWVGNIPFWLLNVIDTIGVAAIIGVIAVQAWMRRKGRKRNSRGSGAVWTIVGLILLAVVLALIGITIPTILQQLHKFVFGSSLLAALGGW